MLLERLFTDDVQYVVNTLGSTQITAFFENDKYYLKMLCWPTGAVDEYSLSDCRNLATALFVEEADTLQLLDVPLQNFIPITRVERGTLTHEELMSGLKLMSNYFDVHRTSSPVWLFSRYNCTSLLELHDLSNSCPTY